MLNGTTGLVYILTQRLEIEFMQIQQDEKFHAISKTHLATIFKEYGKYTKKDFIKSMHVAFEIQ